MPNETLQNNLDQPWKQWASDIDRNKADAGEESICVNKIDSTHGTVALNPRTDVNFSVAKPRPVMNRPKE
ncbi:hypothetical protein TWF481_006085 [Arthrobotrys musiformis]|uniref:Ataxin-2 C-terminal domain-containing protein n=1 Tax=Arthrobotrys musiformis TaxID=47236 RepID=A0AAV9WFQ0_9PEZI